MKTIEGLIFCCVLNVCDSPEVHMLKSYVMVSGGRAFESCWDHESGALMRLVVLWKETSLTLRGGVMRNLRCRTGSSPDHADTLVLKLQLSKLREIKFCYLWTTQSMVFYCKGWMGEDSICVSQLSWYSAVLSLFI